MVKVKCPACGVLIPYNALTQEFKCLSCGKVVTLNDYYRRKTRRI